MAGRLVVESPKNGGALEGRLVRVDKPILRIPTLAIHLDRGVNEKFAFNNETQLLPVLATVVKAQLSDANPAGTKEGAKSDSNGQGASHQEGFMKLLAEKAGLKDAACIKDFELCLYDTQPSALGGLYDEFIHSPRLDNLGMSFCSLEVDLNYCIDKFIILLMIMLGTCSKYDMER